MKKILVFVISVFLFSTLFANSSKNSTTNWHSGINIGYSMFLDKKGENRDAFQIGYHFEPAFAQFIGMEISYKYRMYKVDSLENPKYNNRKEEMFFFLNSLNLGLKGQWDSGRLCPFLIFGGGFHLGTEYWESNSRMDMGGSAYLKWGLDFDITNRFGIGVEMRYEFLFNAFKDLNLFDIALRINF